MATLQVESSKVIDAPPETVYGIIADYRGGHPRILPKKYFPEMEVLEGGKGAGTVIRVKSKMGGQERTLRMAVSETEPGRVIEEKDQASDMRTTFTIAPHDDGGKSHVTIKSEWTPGGGFMGLMERLFSPGMLRRVYTEELDLLAREATSAGRGGESGGSF
jgi:uncharacterized protein YndB with AHSA1/START domain